MYLYFAQFSPAENGGYDVMFPDLDGCTTSGDSLAEALFMAQDMLRTWIETALEEGDKIPAPSDYEKAKKRAEALCTEMDLPVNGEEFYQLVQTEVSEEKPIRMNISMTPTVLRLVDSAAKREGMTRSGFLAMTAKRYIHEQVRL